MVDQSERRGTLSALRLAARTIAELRLAKLDLTDSPSGAV